MANLVLFNKPFNVLSQFTDKEGRPTLANYITLNGVYAAGRLDYDSEGLLLLTDDGALQHQISHPKNKLAKTYWVQVEGAPSTEDLIPFQQGIQLKDGPCQPAKASVMAAPSLWQRHPPIRERQNIPTTWLEITLTEGRNRQVRRMTSAIGFPTLRLIRAQIGPWSLGDIQPGECRVETIHSARKKTSPTPRRTHARAGANRKRR